MREATRFLWGAEVLRPFRFFGAKGFPTAKAQNSQY